MVTFFKRFFIGLAMLIVTLSASFFLHAFTTHGMNPVEAVDCANEEITIAIRDEKNLLKTKCSIIKEGE